MSIRAHEGETHTGLSFDNRMAHLMRSYIGPLLGIRLRLVTIDRIREPWLLWSMLACWTVIGGVALAFYVSGPVGFGLIVVLASVYLYAFSNIAQIVCEYRIYLSLLGVAFIAASLVSYAGTYNEVVFGLSIALLACWTFATSGRLELYVDSVKFWSNAARYAPEIQIAAITERAYEGQFSDVDKILYGLITDDMPASIYDWINARKQQAIDTYRIERARDTLKHLLTGYEHNNPRVWRQLGITEYYLGQTQEAIDSFMRAWALDRTDGLSRAALAHIYEELGDLPCAEVAWKSAADLMPDSGYVRARYKAICSVGRMIDEIDDDPNTIFVTDEMLSEELRNKIVEGER